MSRKEIGYEIFDSKVRRLELMIRSDEFVPEIIIAIGRGGWLPAMIFTDIYKKIERRYRLFSILLSSYTDENKRKFTREHQALSLIDLNYIRKSGKNVLIIDDISDTGKSLKWVINRLQIKDESRLKTATVYIKPNTYCIPDYYIEEIPNNVWVLFPHEKEEFS